MSDPLPFSFKPDWSEPITERLSWLTTVMQSRSGAEQRYAVRLSPRRQIDVPVVLYGQERSYFDVILGRNGGGVWNVPIPHEEVGVGAVYAGQDTFYFNTFYREIAVGTKLLVRQDWYRSEIVEITGITDTSITTTPTVLAYDVASITPTFLGVISDVVTASRPTGRVYTATVRFTSQEPTLWPLTPHASLDTWAVGGQTFLALTKEPNAINPLDYSYERMFSTMDGDAALPLYIDKAARQFTSQKYEFFLVGVQERSNFRDLLFGLKGKLTPLWVPTFNDDLTQLGYPNPLGLSGGVLGREYYISFYRDGTVAFDTTSAYSGVPPEEIDNPAIYRKSFIDLKRLDVDDIEIVHYGTLEGAATCSVIFRDAPDLRVPDNVVVPNYPDAVFHETGGDVTPTNDIAFDSPTVADLVAEQTVMP